MKRASQLDRLPTPEFPEHYSAEDQKKILLILEGAKQQALPYKGHYAAPWLLVDFRAKVWFTRNRNREEQVNGEWRNAIVVDWRVRLPNGALLTDARYEVLLTLLRTSNKTTSG